MKNKLITLAAILMIAGFTSNVMAQSATVTDASAGAVLIKALGLTQTAALHFGTILNDGTAGKVILPSNSTTRSKTGDGTVLSAITPIAVNGAFNVTGTGLETYALTLPSSITVTSTTLMAGTKTMTVDELKARFNSAGADAVTSTLVDAGTDSFTIGGTLNIALTQASGVYAGTYTLSVDYN